MLHHYIENGSIPRFVDRDTLIEILMTLNLPIGHYLKEMATPNGMYDLREL